MKKVEKEVADRYFRTRTTLIIIFLGIGFLVSFGVVAFAEFFSQFTFLGVELHYYMGSQGAVVIFILCLFFNAVLSDRIDRKFGIDDEANTSISNGKTINH
ncbi:putative solute:sodium symporter small subunit [Alteribacillus persepolensis]|uniref:Putative solute:sodium symporter small subunit n=1 Tax=Alteribacillus persepolensis TaxID=568899 RepID=A0A1G8HAU7_9BACI|nr:sodium/substrate symporter small subunit [Alteribacillus persepolensis]SDI03709.1 putative solute:sodium symporter small subunit [Alteribacillus persepolensis]